jgi:hypothetical protein
MRILSLEGSTSSPSKSFEALFYLHEIQTRKSPAFDRALRYLKDNKNPLWERACSRWRWIIQHQYRLIRRHREQARSHS